MLVAAHLGDGDHDTCRFQLASGPVRRGQMVRGSADGIVWRPIFQALEDAPAGEPFRVRLATLDHPNQWRQ
jgi:hypothetical protein